MPASQGDPSEDANVGSEKQTTNAPSTFVVISSNTAAESIISGLKGDSNSATSVNEEQSVIDATDLTEEQWTKIL